MAIFCSASEAELSGAGGRVMGSGPSAFFGSAGLSSFFSSFALSGVLSAAGAAFCTCSIRRRNSSRIARPPRPPNPPGNWANSDSGDAKITASERTKSV